MKRRDFLVQSGLAVGAGLLARVPLAAQAGTSTMAPGMKLLRRNVGIFSQRGGTIGWLANGTAMAAIDTQFPASAEKALAGIRNGRDALLDVTINTHHHGDHTGGNGVLGGASRQLVAHANVPALQRAAAEERGTLGEQVYATTTFTDEWRMALGDEVGAARYFGPAHTKGDIVVSFEQANVVHLGDLCFNRLYPRIDGPGGANIGHWITVLERIVAEYPADAHYVCGHGKAEAGVVVKPADVLVFRDYLSGLLEYAQARIAAGASREELMATENLPGFPEFHTVAPNRLSGNLGAAYDELTRPTE